MLSQFLSAAAWDAAYLLLPKKQRKIDRREKIRRKKIKRKNPKTIQMEKKNLLIKKINELFEILNFEYILFI